ncbi:response regulator receiver domain-containing protein [Mariniflexile fucanivorans]|uniref:Response regulator receiver domain-containing protein n=1 Tax=Mariniflexile fucanivorans TaxID=264023 RepID=A0A4R1RHA7_9FLAO|nr:response regulator [Mariniflexile fucanivorans]TCL65100.1 response regulator receiver domain-containing protein [Mariniflexile fucanivorans]
MKLSILIIEDNEQNMYMLSYLLEKSNFKVLKAYNGIDGLKLASENKPDIILIDIQLPDMDGYEICNKLSHNGLSKNTVFITVTSYAMGGDKEKSMEAGADGYIEKPIDPDTFIEQMMSIYKIKNKKLNENDSNC